MLQIFNYISNDASGITQYLVLGHFKRKAGYTKGMHIVLWLALADFDKLGRVQRGGRR